MKLPYELDISIITERENPFDALISKNGVLLDDLPKGAKVGTGSLRRVPEVAGPRGRDKPAGGRHGCLLDR